MFIHYIYYCHKTGDLMKRIVLLSFLFVSLFSGSAIANQELYQEIVLKSNQQNLDLNQLLQENGLNPESYSQSDPSLDELYLKYKESGATAPTWLIEAIFPQDGQQGNVSRDGGDGPEDATLIEDTSIGSCFEDSGTTEDKTDVLPSPVELPDNCNSTGYTTSFSAPDAWYVFTLEVDTYISTTTCLVNTLYDTAIGFFDEDLIPFAVNDDTDCEWSWRSGLECIFPAGTYYLVVDGYNETSLGAYDIEVCFSGNPCDDFLPTISTIEFPGTFSGDNTDAVDAFNGNGGDLGYEFSTTGGIFTFDSCNENTLWDVDLAVYDGNPCDGAALIASSTWSNCLTGSSPAAAILSNVALEAGDYFLLVTDTGVGFGEFEISIYSACDVYSENIIEYTAPLTFNGSNVGGVDIIGGQGGEAGFDITIPETDLWTISSCSENTTFDVDFWIYETNPCDGGALLQTVQTSNCEAPWGSAVIRDLPLDAGVYHLIIGSTWTNEGDFEILIEPTPERPTSGDPDEMGYTWINSHDPAGPEFEWVDISGFGDLVDLSDDSFNGPLEIGFDFPFYEEAYGQLFICSNGFISFGEGSSSLSNTLIPSSNPPNNIIAMFWDDLDPPEGNGTVFTFFDPANNRYIVQFDHVEAYPGGGSPNSFQAVLYPSGIIYLNMLDMDEGDIAGATIGTENTDGTIGLQINYNDIGCIIADETTILIEPIDGDFIAPQIVHQAIPELIEEEIEGGIEILATITDESGISEAWISWVSDGGVNDVFMTNTEGDAWVGYIPHQEAGTILTYYISATDLAETPNTRVTTSWSTNIVSYLWPPANITASQNNTSSIALNWEIPVNPDDFNANHFGMDPEELMLELSMTAIEAREYWSSMHSQINREFINYLIYRNGEEIAQTTLLYYNDPMSDVVLPGVFYDYYVVARYDSGDSEVSATVEGFITDVTFGYTWVSSESISAPQFDWVEISAIGTNLNLTGLDAFVDVAMDIEFPFFDVLHTQIKMSTNGFLTFGDSATPYFNQPIPGVGSSYDAIFPFWDDFDMTNAGQAYYYYDEENSRVIFQWNEVPHFMLTEPSTFQAILYESGMIRYQYLDMDMGEGNFNGATIGIEDVTELLGLQIAYNNTLLEVENELALTIFPPALCEAIECEGIPEVEPNEGWNDENASYNVIQCDDVICGSIMEDGAPTGSDWFMYNHFGGDVIFTLDVSTFDAVLSLHELNPQGDTIEEVNTMLACANEVLAVNALESGTYLIQVRHEGEAEIDEPGTYALNLICTGDPCAGHIAIECEGTPEVEPNEGWNDGNASYGEIGSGETVCGTVTAVDGVRDLDWFLFSTTAYVNLSVSSLIDAFDCTLFLTDYATEGETIFAIDDAPACHGESFTYDCLPPGDYYLVIGPATAYGVPVEQPYSLTLDISDCSESSCFDVVDIGQLSGTYSDNRPAPIANHNDAINGCSETINSPGLDETHMLVLATDANDGFFFTVQGEGDADEVLYILGDCENPEVTCGAVIDEYGAGAEAEVLELATLPAGTYYFVADFATIEGSTAYALEIGYGSGIDTPEVTTFALHQNYPNPFNPVTTISWDQPELAPATLTIYNILGEVVQSINLGYRGPGQHDYLWDASQHGSGVYLYTFESGNFSRTRKAILLK
jgi:hypothetical protein